MGIDKSLLIKDDILRDIIGDWKEFFHIKAGDKDIKLIQLHERTGRPLGDTPLIEKLECILKRNLKKKRAGRKKER